MLSTTKAIPNLEVIPNTTNVIEEIIRQSLETAVLIGEYTKLDFGSNSVPHLHDPAEPNDALFIVRTVKIQTSGLKHRIENCQKKWDGLSQQLSLRIAVDTNIQAHDTNIQVHDTNIQVQGIRDLQLGIAEIVFFR